MTVLVPHEPGCKWSRFDGEVDDEGNIVSGAIQPGHSDAAKRISDVYNLHRAAGQVRGWIAFKYLDGTSDDTVYDSRADAVGTLFPREDEYFFVTLQAAPSMSVCAAESFLRWKRVMARMDRAHTDRDLPGGGREVIPRLAAEDQENQIRAIRTGKGSIAMGYRKA